VGNNCHFLQVLVEALVEFPIFIVKSRMVSAENMARSVASIVSMT